MLRKINRASEKYGTCLGYQHRWIENTRKGERSREKCAKKYCPKEAQRSTSTINKKRPTDRHIRVKMLKSKGKETILKATRKKNPPIL